MRKRIFKILFAVWVTLLCVVALPTHALERVRLSIGQLDHPAIALQGLQFLFALSGVPPELRIQRLRLGSRSWDALQLTCSRLSPVRGQLDCKGGELRVAGRRLPVAMDFRFDPRSAALEVAITFPSGSKLQLRHDGSTRLELALVRFRIEDLTPIASTLLPAVAAELQRVAAKGVVDARLVWHQSAADPAQERIELKAALDDAAFSTPDGLQAVDGVRAVLEGAAERGRTGWLWQGRVAWERGQAYFHPLYLQAGVMLEASGGFDDEQIVLHSGSVDIEGVSQLAVSARIGLQPLALQDLALSLAGGDLAILGPRWIVPMLAPALAERLRFTGHVGAGIEIRAGRFAALDAVFDQAGISLSAAVDGQGFAFGPVSGHLPWSARGGTQARLRVDGGAWEALSFGAFDLVAELAPGSVSFDPIRIPLLDGALVLEGVALEQAPDGWAGQGSAVVEPVSMALLTETLGLPVMSGVLSASMPGVRLKHGEIGLDGALVVSVFEGYLQATGVRVSEPFGVASHLRADIEARHLDLAQLTDTFSFGSMSGYVDADVRGLELVRWRPVAFDARLVSSPGDYRRRISQRAVQNISALGGAGAMAALQRGLLGVFETFGYRQLGFQCVLEGGVCLMGGIDGAERADGGFQIIRGGGVPALDVIGYNRRVDWNEFVSRIQRVIEDNVTPERR